MDLTPRFVTLEARTYICMKVTDESKRDAVAQIEDRGHPVCEVAERLGGGKKSIYTRQWLISRPAKVSREVGVQADDIR